VRLDTAIPLYPRELNDAPSPPGVRVPHAGICTYLAPRRRHLPARCTHVDGECRSKT